MRFRCLAIALALLAAFTSDSWGQSKQPPPNKQTTQPPATDQRGTDQVPLAVKVLPAQDAKAIIVAERPYVFFKITKPGLISQNERLIPDTETKGRLHFELINVGRTPA